MFNPMERIRKLSNMPAMIGGYPPPTHRKCSDWAQYITAVDSVTRELVDMLIQCQASGLKEASERAKLAGENAAMHDKLRDSDRFRALTKADSVLIENNTPVDVRNQVKEVIAHSS